MYLLREHRLSAMMYVTVAAVFMVVVAAIELARITERNQGDAPVIMLLATCIPGDKKLIGIIGTSV